MMVNHKRVARIMREDNLLAIRHRKYILTTDSQHDYPVYLNLAARMTVTGINQLWVADITYIRLRKEFVFLAVVIDRYSRKAIGWALYRSLSAEVALSALRWRSSDAGRRREWCTTPIRAPSMQAQDYTSELASPRHDPEHEPSGKSL